MTCSASYTATLSTTSPASVTVSEINCAASASDNCGVSSLTPVSTSYTCGNTGPNALVFLATDIYSNTASCATSVTVKVITHFCSPLSFTEDISDSSFTQKDVTNPTPYCNDPTVALNSAGSVTITPAKVYNSTLSTDNCQSSPSSLSQSTFTCNDEGQNIITLTAVDPSGNAGTCQSTVTVVVWVPSFRYRFLELRDETAEFSL